MALGVYYPTSNRDDESPIEKFTRLYLLGQKMKAEREREMTEAENRKIMLQLSKAQLKQAEIRMKAEARGLVEKEAEGLERLPGKPSDLPIPPMLGHGLGSSVPDAGPRTPVIPNLHIPGVPELGLPEYDRPIRTFEDVLAQRHREVEEEGRAKREGNRIELPTGVAEDYNMAPGSRIDPELLSALSRMVRLPPGITKKGPYAEGGRISEREVPLVTAAANRESIESEGAATRRNQLDVARIYAANRPGSTTPGGRISPDAEAQVKAVADAIETGEIPSIREGQIVLGGVRGGLGPALVKELASRNSRVVSPKVRESLRQIQSARTLSGKIRDTVQAVINAKSIRERVEMSYMLDSLTHATAAMMSKGFGETGRLAEGDIQRVRAIVPGWKAANFNPDFALKEADYVDDIFNRVEKSVLDSYYKEYEKTPEGGTRARAPEGGGTEAFDPTNSYGYPVGTKIRGPNNQILTWDGNRWQ